MAIPLATWLGTATEYAPAGYAIGLHVRFTSPTYLFQTYPAAWNEHYSANGLVMQDPTVAWGFSETGARRWSDLMSQDAANVLGQAAEFGLVFGVMVSSLQNGSRSLGGFARADREFSDEEMERLTALMDAVHALTADEAAISPEDQRTITEQSVTV